MKVNDDKEGEEIEQIELEIDGILFEEHPYLDKDFGKHLPIYKAFLFKLNLTVPFFE